ncbi:Iojap protein [Campylobacter insulaenigrae]|uniref:ribosome silencing factor n=1 Tax=Campylobacter insulaenigrae TaxID=260714 RepID=UPI000F7050E0|nr:ribosome silencing factor [Campylobacter insulaenigrae]MCR6590819.1 ribosome silencing factor [Campylobacter insulaenigrae]MCR6592496.1 ribosome silencing factor [Campylobacter insulaenigrae]VEJ52908.1 Iojap protein [Campylobacter insulaenigrae]
MQERIDNIVKILDDKKADFIEIFDMQNKDYFVKFVVIATTMGERHALSLLDDLKTNLKNKGEEFLNIESSEEWTAIDLGDILIHLMSENYRQKYNIEDFLKTLNKDNKF